MPLTEDLFENDFSKCVESLTKVAKRRLPPSCNTPMADIPVHKMDKVHAKRSLRDYILSARFMVKTAKKHVKQAMQEGSKQP